MKKIISILSLFGLALSVSAGPALRQIIKLAQPNGDSISAVFSGDENLALYHDVNTGKRLVQDEHTKVWREMIPLEEQISRKSYMQMRDVQAKTSGSISPSVAKDTIPVLLVEFADLVFSDVYASGGYASTQEMAEDYFNGANYHFDGAASSVSKYFQDESNGAFRPVFEILGTVKLSKNHEVYGQSNSTTATAVAEALDSAYVHGLFTSEQTKKWDNNYDGTVDLVYVLFAGYQESDNGMSEFIWPHYWNYGINKSYGTGATFRNYLCTAELTGKPSDAEKVPASIGIAVHEFGHAIGLPDFYDVDSKSGAQACYGMDYWSIMDSGNQVNTYRNPVSMTAYERMALGWMEVPELPLGDDSIVVTLKPIDTHHEAYIYRNPNNADEAFLFENHQRTGYDIYWGNTAVNYMHGMLITHLDYKAGRWSNNSVNTECNNQLYTVVPADGVLKPYRSQTYNNYAELYTWVANERDDIWPSLNRIVYEAEGVLCKMNGPYTTFSKDTNPAAKFKDGTEAEFVIENIKDEDNVISFSLKKVGYSSPTTAIDQLNAAPKGKWQMMNGKMYYKSGDATYDLLGRKL